MAYFGNKCEKENLHAKIIGKNKSSGMISISWIPVDILSPLNQQTGQIKIITLDKVEVGDMVRAHRPVRAGWGSVKWFWVNRTIQRVTKCEFTVNGTRYRKNNGKEVSGAGSARPVRPDGADESAEMTKYIHWVRMQDSIRSTAGRVCMQYPLPHDHPDLDEIASLMREVAVLLDGQQTKTKNRRNVWQN